MTMAWEEIDSGIDYQFRSWSIAWRAKGDEGIKGETKRCQWNLSIRVWLASRVVAMRFCKVLLTIVVCSTCKTIDEVECTILRDTARTLPSDFWPSNWLESIRQFLANGGLWELPKNTAMRILRLVSPLNAGTGPVMIAFKPEDGPHASYAYQQRFGFRGHRLIELLGTGFGSYRETIEQPVLEFSLTPPLPSRWRTFA